MADLAVGHEHHGSPVALGQVEGPHRQVEHLLDRPGREGDDLVVPVGAILGLVDVLLGGEGGLPRGGAAPLNVDHHARGLRHVSVAYVLLHQAVAGARGGRHRLGPRPGGPYHGRDRRDLVLHLQEETPSLGHLRRNVVGDLVGGSDGIAREEAAAHSQRSLGASLVPQDEVSPWLEHQTTSSTEIAKSGQDLSHQRHPMQSPAISGSTPPMGVLLPDSFRIPAPFILHM